MIQTVNELAEYIGKEIWLVCCFKHNDGAIYKTIGNTHIARWEIGSIINLEGQNYAADLEGPWFCVERTKTRYKNGKICNYMFNVDDYLSGEHRMFATETKANQYRLVIKMKNTRSKIDFDPMDQYFIFEGTSIAMEDFLAGNIPRFGKDAWVKPEA